MKPNYKKILDHLVYLYKGYATEFRATTQPFRWKTIKSVFPNQEYYPKDILYRETLIEHSGVLPVMATAIFPYINNPHIDLGKALIMLAIHDIGELIVGDEIVFAKQTGSADEEEKEALKLLPESFHSIYLDMERQISDTGKFAKAIDQIVPDIIDMITPPELTIMRYKTFVKKEPHEIIPMIIAHKRQYVQWNEFLTNLHREIMKRTEFKLKQFYKK